VGTVGDSNFESVPPKPIPELVDLNKVGEMYFICLMPLSYKLACMYVFIDHWPRGNYRHHRRLAAQLQDQGTNYISNILMFDMLI
jgi:hypothetical protein